MYDLAVSFAGENRQFVEHVKSEIQNHGFTIFYDNDFQTELWGSDLTIELPKRYIDSRFVALFLDDYYLNKMWTFFERQIIIENYLKLKGADYILPIFLNGFSGQVPGLSGLVGHLTIDTMKDKDYLVQLLLKKLS